MSACQSILSTKEHFGLAPNLDVYIYRLTAQIVNER